MNDAIGLDAYFSRIGYSGPREPSLAVLHAISAAHVGAIPFENLDVLLGRAISLELSAVFAKLVTSRRGGYCFEQNGLLLHVLQSLGFRAAALGARVRIGRPRDYTPPRTHMFVRVELGGESWLADVGVGGLSLTSAIRLHAEGEQPTAHEPRRIQRERDRLFHQVRFGETWNDVAEFTLDDMPPIDRELANWFTSAHPRSHFRDHLMVARALPDGRRVSLLDCALGIRERDGRAETTTVASNLQLLAVLRDHFGLHLPPETRIAVPGAPWPI